MNEILTLIRAGKIEEAENELNRREGEVGQSAQYHYTRGLVLEKKGEVEEAIEAFESAIEIDGDHLEAAFRLVFNLDMYGNEERAVQMYELLADRPTAHVNALINLAVIYEDRGQFRRSLGCVERVLTEYPNHSRALLFRKDIQSSMNMHYDEAQERSREKRDAVLDTPVSDFELSVRSRNCLKKMNIHSLGDLLRITESELLAYKNFGETSLNEIKVMLTQKGLYLGQLKEEAQGGEQGFNSPQMEFQNSMDISSKYLSELEFSGRSRKCLQRLNLVTVGDLLARTETELLAAKNFGQTSLNEVKQKLTELGLSLRK
jgi:DNA-directed RNA polymerase subunit alpha